MPELTRLLIARMREFFGNRRRARRHALRLPFKVSLFDAKLTPAQLDRAPHLDGHTRDISTGGLALIVPAIRIEDRYLAAPDQALRLLLEYPTGLIEMRVAAVRYERLEEADADTGYLIGVRITEMADDDRARFVSYLKDLN
ncbi:MAG TPA: PilZ domain-containing protein [Pyrinomonadaceae bacterium]|nr:PilZ domain-containing protein [Pyrinomonadaceae bacterium]